MTGAESLGARLLRALGTAASSDARRKVRAASATLSERVRSQNNATGQDPKSRVASVSGPMDTPLPGPPRMSLNASGATLKRSWRSLQGPDFLGRSRAPTDQRLPESPKTTSPSPHTLRRDGDGSIRQVQADARQRRRTLGRSSDTATQLASSVCDGQQHPPHHGTLP
jgi:hypothetical protein